MRPRPPNRVTTPRTPPSPPKPPLVVRPRFFPQRPRIVILPKPGRRRDWNLGAGTIALGFIALILAGTVLLSLPAAHAPDRQFDLLTSFFTAVSAVCVTGLVVVDTATHWSFFGELVILLLIQAGGLGIMTAATVVLILLGRGVSLRDRLSIQETAGLNNVRTVNQLMVATVVMTAVFEAIGAASLYWQLAGAQPEGDRVWHSVFHAVSGFNNAGFDLRGEFSSLMGFSTSPAALVVMALLVIAGGLGPLPFLDVIGSRGLLRLSVQTKLVVSFSLLLLLVGTLGVLASEYANPSTLGPLAGRDKVFNAFFHSTNTRTAGFNSVPVGALQDETQLLSMVLMAIGGSTGSAAGGIKVGTFALLVLATLAAVRGHNTVRFANREFGHPLVYRALGVATLYLGIAIVGTMALTITDDMTFRSMLFEAVSALSTVGLSTGITPDLSIAGKLVLTVLMFAGRIGPLAVVFILANKAREPVYRLPEGHVGIG